MENNVGKYINNEVWQYPDDKILHRQIFNKQRGTLSHGQVEARPKVKIKAVAISEYYKP